MPPPEALRFLVVGCGSIGKRHIRNLTRLKAGEILACETAPERQEEIRKEFGIPVRSSLAEALQACPNAVLVCTPPVLHGGVAQAALDAGCHLFVEKPISHSAEGLEQLVRTAEQKDLVTLVGYNWRFHPCFRKMKQWVEEEIVGKILSAQVNCGQYLPEWHPWEDYRQTYSALLRLGGGVLLDSHELDYVTWLLGPVEQMGCAAGKRSRLEIETEDTADLILLLSSGAQATVHLDYLQRPAQRSYQFYGSEGSIRWSLEDGLSVYRVTAGRWERWEEPKDFDLNCTYLEELRHFIACIQGQETSLVDARRGKYVIELISTAKVAAEQSCFLPIGPPRCER